MTYFMVGVSVVAFLMFSLIASFVHNNNYDPRLNEVVLPVVGALLFSALWIIKAVYLDAPKSEANMFPVINFEYENGGIIPVYEYLKKNPVQIENKMEWIEYVQGWNHNFLNKTQELKKSGKSDEIIEKLRFEYFEYYWLKKICGRFGLGWNHDDKYMMRLPVGLSGAGSYGIENKDMDKVDLRQLAGLDKMPNNFISSSRDSFQLAVPKGSVVEVKRSASGTSIVVSHKRFKFAIGFESNGSKFTGVAFQNHTWGPFVEKVFEIFKDSRKLPNINSIVMRTFYVSRTFEQDPKYRFNQMADLDIKFSNNIWRFIENQSSWNELKLMYEEVLN